MLRQLGRTLAAADRYRVEYEESYYTERTKRTVTEPWLMILLCQHGHISPWGGDILAACTNRSGQIPNRLMAAVPSAEMWMDGDDGANIKFHVRDFDDVAEIMKPRRRRRLSGEQRQAAVERLRNYQYPARQPAKTGQERAQRGSTGVRSRLGSSRRFDAWERGLVPLWRNMFQFEG